jgi:hypothetical protein
MTQFTRRKFDDVPPTIAAKWSATVMDEGYVPFPKRLLRCMSLIFEDVRDVQTILAVVDYRRANPTRAPSYDFLAFTAGMLKEDFRNCVAKLANKGVVKISGIDDAITIDIQPLLKKIEQLTDEMSSTEEPL